MSRNLWRDPSDEIAFQEFLAEQVVEMIPPPGASQDDEVGRLHKLLCSQQLIARGAIADRDEARRSRGWWRKVALVLAGSFAIALAVNAAAIWWAR